MENREVMVVYKWTDKEGNSAELKPIYKQVEGQMKSNVWAKLRFNAV